MPSFTDLPRLAPAAWDAMLHLGHVRVFSPGHVIFAEGAPALHLYVVQDGLVELVKASVDGDAIRVAILEPGTVFGEGALFASSSRSTTALAFRETAVVELASDRILEFLETEHAFSALLYRAMSERLHQVVLDLDADLQSLLHRLHREASPPSEGTRV